MIYLEERKLDLGQALDIVTRPLHDTFQPFGKIRVKEVMNRFRALKHVGVRVYRGSQLDPPELISSYYDTCKLVVEYALDVDPQLARDNFGRNFRHKY